MTFDSGVPVAGLQQHVTVRGIPCVAKQSHKAPPKLCHTQNEHQANGRPSPENISLCRTLVVRVSAAKKLSSKDRTAIQRSVQNTANATR